MTDPYRTLGVDPAADYMTIQAAYRRLMREHHPDRAGDGDDDRAQDINAAFAILKDPHSRARYDAQMRDRVPPAILSRHYSLPPIVRRRGPSLEARQRRLREVRWVKRGLLIGACLMVGLGAIGAAMNFRGTNSPWPSAAVEMSDKLVAESRQSLQDRLG